MCGVCMEATSWGDVSSLHFVMNPETSQSVSYVVMLQVFPMSASLCWDWIEDGLPYLSSGDRNSGPHTCFLFPNLGGFPSATGSRYMADNEVPEKQASS